MSLLEGDFYLNSGKPACMCSIAQLEFLCRQMEGDSREWKMATCFCGGEEWGQMTEMRQGEKLVRAPLKEVNPSIFSLEKML